MSLFDNDWLKNGFPQFAGGKDKTVARKMVDHLGGPDGIRTATRTLPDGSVVVMKLRGDMPPLFMTTRKEIPLQKADIELWERDYAERTWGDSIIYYVTGCSWPIIASRPLTKIVMVNIDDTVIEINLAAP